MSQKDGSEHIVTNTRVLEDMISDLFQFYPKSYEQLKTAQQQFATLQTIVQHKLWDSTTMIDGCERYLSKATQWSHDLARDLETRCRAYSKIEIELVLQRILNRMNKDQHKPIWQQLLANAAAMDLTKEQLEEVSEQFERDACSDFTGLKDSLKESQWVTKRLCAFLDLPEVTVQKTEHVYLQGQVSRFVFEMTRLSKSSGSEE